MSYGLMESLSGFTKKWQWLALLLGRVLLAFVFIKTGFDKLHNLNHSKNILDFFGIVVPADHRWDAFFPFVEIVCGGLMLLGLLTRLSAALLIAVLMAALLFIKFGKLAGLDLSLLQEIALIVSLLILSATGAGAASLDRLLLRVSKTKY